MPTIFLAQPPPISRATKPGSKPTSTKAPITAVPAFNSNAATTTTNHFAAPVPGSIKKSALRRPEASNNDDDDLDGLTSSLTNLQVTTTNGNTTPATDYDILSAQLAVPAYIQWVEEVEQTVDDNGTTVEYPTGYWLLQHDAKLAPKNCTTPKRPYRLSSMLYTALYPHQRECLRWMFSLHLRYSKQPSTGFLYGEGGILADDMGLGKTVQIAAYLAGLFASSLCKRVLIVVPAGTIDNWQNELTKWFSMQTGWKSQSNKSGVRIHQFHGSNRKTRSEHLEKVKRIGGIILTTPDMLKKNMEEICDFSDVQPSTPRKQAGSSSSGSSKLVEIGYDYIIIDEAHLIKSMKTQISLAVRTVPATHRLLVTGTPLQNKLEELYSLMDFITFSSSLGSIVSFKKQYIQPIEDGTDRDADADEIVHSRRVAAQLKQLIAPYILRRQKADIDLTSMMKAKAATDDAAPTELQKNELIVWLKLSPKQSELYKAFTQSEEVKMALNSAKHPLIQLNVVKKICDHPRLLAEKLQTCEALTHLQFTSKDTSAIIEESQKLAFLTELIQKLKAEGHRTLIFSSSTIILNLIQNVLYQHLHWPQSQVLRIDGTVNGDGIRQRLVDQFNSASAADIPVMLLSTGAGAEGLNLTGADRVIIYDPAWNPSKDNQAIGRAFRIGQTRNVVAYRLVTCGTVEEVIYRNQIFKSSLIRAAVEVHRQAPTPNAKQAKRDNDALQTPSKKFEAIDLDKPGYFTKSELREVFTLFDHAESTTCQQLQTLHPPSQRRGYKQLAEHIQWIQQSSSQVYGITDHDLLFSTHTRPQADATATQTPAKVTSSAELAAPAAIATPPRRVYTYTDFAANPVAHKKPAATTNNNMFSRPDENAHSDATRPTLPFSAAASQSCPQHKHVQSAEGEYSFQGQSCRCNFSAEQHQHYQQLLATIPTTDQLKQPASSMQRLHQLDTVLNALDICDDNPLLHLTAMRLGVEVSS